MSNERNGPGMDPLVSETYRELADEKTPEALNREILRLAASEGRTRFAISRAWTRPLAWAATIGLSLVLVLQLTNTPVPDSVDSEETLPDTVAAPRRDALDRDVKEAATAEPSLPPEVGRNASGDERLAEPSLSKRPRAEMQQSPAKVSVANDAAVSEAVEEEALPAAQSFAAPEVRTYPESAAREASATAMEGKTEVASRKRQQERQMTDRPAAGAAAMTSVAIAADAGDPDYLCPPGARETAETWLDCIAAIKGDVSVERLDREYDALARSFPDVELPARQ